MHNAMVRRSPQRPPAGTREPGLPERPEHGLRVRAPTLFNPIAKNQDRARAPAPASNRIDIALALALALALAPQLRLCRLVVLASPKY